jgi:acyl-CoA reductase-like NAD-dependent aldehyde dehydrogenase
MKIISTNPSRNYEILGEVETSTEQEIKDAVAKARKAFIAWSETPLTERCKQITSFIVVSKKRAEEITELIAKETGRPIISSRVNVQGGIEYLEAYLAMAEKYLSPRITLETEKEIHRVYREPRGVIAAILPWNYPFMNVVWQCGQALISGNTIVYKNSEENLLFSKLLEKLIEESDIPDGVFNILYGDSTVGDTLVHQDIDMISFTGSTKVGQYLTKVAAEKFIPIVTELGGSSPLVLFDDIELTDKVIAYIAGRRFKNAGQACDAVKRLIVHKNKFDQLVNKLAKYVSEQKVGDAFDEKTDIGPLVAKRQIDLIEAQVKDAVDKGARVVIGGKRPDDLKGAYYLPTIITNITKNMRVWHEETFGPVLPIVTFETEEEAIELANDTEYGLTAHVLTNDKECFQRVASRIKAGSISQNEVGFWTPVNPFGGYKKSGMGRTHGEFGFEEVTNVKVIAKEK